MCRILTTLWKIQLSDHRIVTHDDFMVSIVQGKFMYSAVWKRVVIGISSHLAHMEFIIC